MSRCGFNAAALWVSTRPASSSSGDDAAPETSLGVSVVGEDRFVLRVVLRNGVVLGPGKADLLQAIQETGSIAAAGRRMTMSYKRAWLLLDALNTCCRAPVVITAKGGATGGGAHLTPAGVAILDAYRRMQRATVPAVAEELAALDTVLRPEPD